MGFIINPKASGAKIPIFHIKTTDNSNVSIEKALFIIFIDVFIFLNICLLF